MPPLFRVGHARLRFASRSSAAGQVVEHQSPKSMSQVPLNRHGAFRADPCSGEHLYREQTTENRCIIASMLAI